MDIRFDEFKINLQETRIFTLTDTNGRFVFIWRWIATAMALRIVNFCFAFGLGICITHCERFSDTIVIFIFSAIEKDLILKLCLHYESSNIIHLHWYCVWFIFDDRTNWHKIKIRCNCLICFFGSLAFICGSIFFVWVAAIQSIQVNVPWRRRRRKRNEIDSHWSVNELCFVLNLLEIFRHCTLSQILSASVRKNIGSIKM